MVDTKALTAVGSCCVKTVMGIILCLALVSVHHLGYEWEQTITDVDIYTIQDPRYWGPMTMLVPNNCTTLQSMMARRNNTNSTQMWELPANFDKPEYMPLQTNLLGHPVLPSRDVVNFVAVTKCNHTIEALDPSWMQYYWASMITASSGFNIDGLHSSRMNFFWFFFIICMFQFLGQYAQAAVKALVHLNKEKGYTIPEVPLSVTQQLILQVYAKITAIQLQMTFVSLFITYWHEDHYLMNYFPGRGFLALPLFFCVLAFLFAETTRMAQQQAMRGPYGEPDKTGSMRIMGCACFACFLCCFGIFPVTTGWQIYNLQFLWGLFMGEHQSEVAFSASFPSMQQTVGHASKHLIGINVVDAAVATAEAAVVAARQPEEIGSDMTGMLLDDDTALP